MAVYRNFSQASEKLNCFDRIHYKPLEFHDFDVGTYDLTINNWNRAFILAEI